MVRKLFPVLFAELSSENLTFEHEDVVAEIQYAMNSGYSHNGSTHYNCLYGVEPNFVFPEDNEFIVPPDSHGLFYEHQLCRAKAITAFQQALIDERIERLSSSRNRTNNQSTYIPGMWVDFYRKTSTKQLEGWRGPAVVLALLGEGYVTIRWQSHTLDVPVPQLRPHLLRAPTAALHNSGKPTVLALPEVPQEIAIGNDPERAAFIEASCEDLWEKFYFADASDPIADPSFDALVSCVALMPLNVQAIHAIRIQNGRVISTQAAMADFHVIFNLGSNSAKLKAIPNYVGLSLCSGRRYMQSQPGVSHYHVFWWIGDPTSAVLYQATHDTSNTLDFIALGVKNEDIAYLRSIILFEGSAPSGPPLLQMLSSTVQEEPLVVPQGRVRIPEYSQPLDKDPLNTSGQMKIAESFHDETELASTTRVQDEVSSDITTELLEAQFMTMWNEEFEACFPKDDHTWHSDFEQICSAFDVFFFDENRHDEFTSCFPIERNTRPMTAEELKLPAVREARLKELKSWVENSTGFAMLRAEFLKLSNGKPPIPSRWVDTWKLKANELIAKSRLCLKGFAEPVLAGEQNASPTA